MSAIDGNTLDGVSATTLWTLYNRATEAKRSDGIIRDPWAVVLADGIDYDYEKFNTPNQLMALRATAFDVETRAYLGEHPDAAVVALAEGLQTSFWRLDRTADMARTRWYSIDLEPVMDLRRRLLPEDHRITALAQSALDTSWMDRVASGEDPGDGVFITAEGLLMYLEPDDALGLIGACAARFPGGRMMFDSIPPWFSRRTLAGWKLSDRYVAPPMPFGQSADDALALAGRIPGVRAARSVGLPPGRGPWRAASWSAWDRIGPLRRARPSITLLEFG